MFIRPSSKDGEELNDGLSATSVAKNLVELVNESKPGELASLEEVVASLMKDTLDVEKDTVLDPEVSMILLGGTGCDKVGAVV